MMNDDELDCALFALPLAEPPAGLRAAILAATAQAPARLMPGLFMRAPEIALIGSLFAVATWLLTTGLAHTAIVALAPVLASIAGDARLLLWIAIGVAVAATLSVVPSLQLPRMPLRRS